MAREAGRVAAFGGANFEFWPQPFEFNSCSTVITLQGLATT